MLSLADRNLLVGFLAVQMEFVDSDQLVCALRQWVVSRGRLDAILIEQGALSSEQQHILASLVGQHVDASDSTVEESLATIVALLPSKPDGVGSRAADKDGEQTDVEQADVDPTDVEATSTMLGIHAERGRFHILRPHARGGLGEVFVARDTELNREVALKEILPQLLDRVDLKGRFMAEAEITGGLEHPGIVPVYGLGSYSDGRPYYAMRFIRGESLKDAIRGYHAKPENAADRTLELRRLLGRFIDVCNTMEYAHSRGVLHRDLKPANIMLGKYGETLVVDWGLAKSMDAVESAAFAEEAPIGTSGSGSSAPTEMGSVVGTLAYMSPEQAMGRLDLVSAQSDVFSLGATLYCVLVGRAPYVDDDNVHERLSRIQKAEFDLPRSVAAGIPRALESICVKAMARHREDRYPTPAALAADLESWLADEPITAMTESSLARGGRWLRKHRTTAIAVVVASLLITLVSMSAAVFIDAYRREAEAQKVLALGLADDKRNLADAERVAREVADERRLEAERERQEAEAVTSFLIETFRSPAPERDGSTITVAEMLARSFEKLQRGKLAEDPLVRAALADAIGITYRGLALYREAAPCHELAAQLRSEKLGATHPKTLSSINDLAMALYSAGDIDEAGEIFEKTLKLREENLGAKHFDTTASQINLATVYQRQQDLQKAIPLFESACRTREELLGPNHTDTLVALNNLAMALRAEGRMPAAVAMLEDALRRKRASLGANHQSTATAMMNLGESYAMVDDFDRGLPLLEGAVHLRTKIYGADHTATFVGMTALAYGYRKAKRWQEATSLLQASVAGHHRLLGAKHPKTQAALRMLAEVYCETDQTPKAMELLEEDYQQRNQRSKVDRATLVSLSSLGWVCKLNGELDRAEQLLKDAVARSREQLGDDDADTLSAVARLAATCAAQGNVAESQSLLAELVRLREARFGEDHPHTMRAIQDLTSSFRNSNDLEKALPLYQRLVDINEKKRGEADPSTMKAINNLGHAYLLMGDHENAIRILERAWSLRSEHLGEAHAHAVLTLRNLAYAHRAAGDQRRAIDLLEQVLKLREESQGEPDLQTMHALGRLYLTVERLDDCEDIARELVVLQRKRKPLNRVMLSIDLALLGTCLLEQQRFADAELALRETLALREAASKNSWLYSNAKSLLGAAMAGQGQFEEGERLMLEGRAGLVERLQQIPAAQRDDRMRESVIRLVDLYLRWNKPEQQEVWRGKLRTPDGTAGSPP